MVLINAPDEKLYYKGAVNSYVLDKNPDNLNEKFKLRINGTYLDLYVNETDKQLMITIRGTKPSDFRDLYADLKIGLNGLEKSWRFKNDYSKLKEVIKLYPVNKWTYFITGHSLAGAIIASLIRIFPFIKRAVVYNAATQSAKDLPPKQNPKIKYIYTDRDFLYRFNRGYKHSPIKVLKYQPNKTNNFFGWVKSQFNPQMFAAHSLDQPAFKKLYKIDTNEDPIIIKDEYKGGKKKDKEREIINKIIKKKILLSIKK